MDAETWGTGAQVPYVFAPNWQQIQQSERVSVVVGPIFKQGLMLLANVHPGNQMVRLIGDFVPPEGPTQRLSAVNVSVGFSKPFVDLIFDDKSALFIHKPLEVAHLFNLVEFCAGMGASALGFQHAGFTQKCAVEWSSRLAEVHEGVHPKVPVIVADITDVETLMKVRKHSEDPFSLMAGISCQPYSQGGSQNGGDDQRASTLPAVLKACHLMQCPCLFIECVVPARTNAFVRAHLQALINDLGYHVSEKSLKLKTRGHPTVTDGGLLLRIRH